MAIVTVDRSGNAPSRQNQPDVPRGLDVEITGVGKSNIVTVDAEGMQAHQTCFFFPTSNFAGTITCEQSFDNGKTWELINAGTRTYTGTGNENHRCESGIKGGIWQFRFNCTAYTAGSVRCVLSV